jgi:L-lactate dehydrogenase complex protein LldG
MPERDAIFSRIREALTVTAPMPGHHGGGGDEQHQHSESFRQWLPQVGESFAEQLAAFQKASADLKTDFHLLDNEGQAHARLKEIASAEGWRQIATHRHALTDLATANLGLPTLHTDGGYDVELLEKCEAGISACDAMVAQTGSVLVTSRSAGGRALSVLPPHHVVLARKAQLVRDLTAALQLVKHRYAPDYPSFIGFITGPSRTGDIERILVLGAHGPKQLTVLCW